MYFATVAAGPAALHLACNIWDTEAGQQPPTKLMDRLVPRAWHSVLITRPPTNPPNYLEAVQGAGQRPVEIIHRTRK